MAWTLCRFVFLGEDGCAFAAAAVHVVSCLLSEPLSAPEVPFTLSASKSCLPRSLSGRGCSAQLAGSMWVWVPTAGLPVGEPVHCWDPLTSGGPFGPFVLEPFEVSVSMFVKGIFILDWCAKGWASNLPTSG